MSEFDLDIQVTDTSNNNGARAMGLTWEFPCVHTEFDCPTIYVTCGGTCRHKNTVCIF
jgi:hypothetical protein